MGYWMFYAQQQQKKLSFFNKGTSIGGALFEKTFFEAAAAAVVKPIIFFDTSKGKLIQVNWKLCYRNASPKKLLLLLTTIIKLFVGELIELIVTVFRSRTPPKCISIMTSKFFRDLSRRYKKVSLNSLEFFLELLLFFWAFRRSLFVQTPEVPFAWLLLLKLRIYYLYTNVNNGDRE